MMNPDVRAKANENIRLETRKVMQLLLMDTNALHWHVSLVSLSMDPYCVKLNISIGQEMNGNRRSA